MNNSNTSNKRKIVYNYLYATLVGLLVVSLAVIITMASTSGVNTNLNLVEDSLPVATITYVNPMKDALVSKDYSGTELQYNDTLKQWEIHKAIDFKANGSTEVFAIANGTVSNIYTNYLEGTVIEISHTNGLMSIYKSLKSDVLVSVGQTVTAGQTIGNASASMAQEQNSGEHLHLEITKNGTKVNPNDYLNLGNK